MTSKNQSRMIPDKSQALDFHRKAGSSAQIMKHCSLVAKIALIFAKGLGSKGNDDVDERTVFAAALLHDIGRSQTNSILHGVAGARIAKDFGCDERIVEIVRRHVGAGISDEEARKYGFPAGDYIPRTLEQKVVCFADKLVASDRVAPLEKEAEKFRRKGLDVERLYSLRDSVKIALGEDPEEYLFKKITSNDEENPFE